MLSVFGLFIFPMTGFPNIEYGNNCPFNGILANTNVPGSVCVFLEVLCLILSFYLSHY